MVMLLRVKKFIQNNIVCSIAFVLALITCIFVPIDREYIHYVDYKTI